MEPSTPGKRPFAAFLFPREASRESSSLQNASEHCKKVHWTRENRTVREGGKWWERSKSGSHRPPRLTQPDFPQIRAPEEAVGAPPREETPLFPQEGALLLFPQLGMGLPLLPRCLPSLALPTPSVSLQPGPQWASHLEEQSGWGKKKISHFPHPKKTIKTQI